MKPALDMHIHTNVSCDARGSILEYVEYAKKIGLKGFAITDHGYLKNLGSESFKDIVLAYDVLPEYIDGIRILKGYEANITSKGTIDVDLDYRKYDYIDWLTIGFHQLDELSPPDGISEKDYYTNLLLQVLDTYDDIKVIHHLVDYRFPMHYDKILDKVEEVGCALEVNASVGKRARHEVLREYKSVIKRAYEREIPLVMSSDAHFVYSLGDYEMGFKTLKELNIPLSYLANYNLDTLNTFMNKGDD